MVFEGQGNCFWSYRLQCGNRTEGFEALIDKVEDFFAAPPREKPEFQNSETCRHSNQHVWTCCCFRFGNRSRGHRPQSRSRAAILLPHMRPAFDNHSRNFRPFLPRNGISISGFIATSSYGFTRKNWAWPTSDANAEIL